MKKLLCPVLCIVILLVFTACGTDLSGSSTKDCASSSKKDSSAVSASDTTAVSSSDDIEAIELTDGNYDLSFTKRDCNASYDESSACIINFTSDSAAVKSGKGAEANGGTVTVKDEGVYVLSGDCSNGQIIVDAENEKIQLVLNELKLSSKTSPIVIKSADKVFVTLAENTENTLSDSASYNLTIDNSTVDAAVFSKADLTINGQGTLTVNGNMSHAIVSKDDLVISGCTLNINSVSAAIDGKDCLKIRGCTLNITSGGDGLRSSNVDETDSKGFVYIADGSFKISSVNDAIQAASLLRIDGGSFEITSNGGTENAIEHHDDIGGNFGFEESFGNSETDTESAKGIKAGLELKLNGGDYTINTSDDSLHSNGSLSIADGSFEISAGDDGIHADDTVTIDGGIIDIIESYEGIEGGSIITNAGTVSVVSGDDGYNVNNSAGELTFNGGYVYVDAQGDGIDSNNTICINGGTVLINGPSNNGNAAVDYGTSATVTGGVLAALGSSGMAETVSGDGQGVIMTSVSSQTEGTSFALTDSSGNVIASLKSARKFDCVYVSSPSISSGNTYTIVCGGKVSNADDNGFASSGSISGGTEICNIEMTSDTYSSGGLGMNGNAENGGMNMGGNGINPEESGRNLR